MENFTFALNATIPVFLVIALGYVLQRVHFLNDAFNKTANEVRISVRPARQSVPLHCRDGLLQRV